MSSIDSIYDNRLGILFSIIVEYVESEALAKDRDPELILISRLLNHTRKIHDWGNEMVIDKIKDHYPELITVIS